MSDPRAGEAEARALAERLGVDVWVLRNGIRYQARIGVRPAGPIVAPIIDSDTEAEAWTEVWIFLSSIRRIPTAEELAELERERDEARAVAGRMAVIARDLQRKPCARHGVYSCPYQGCSEPTDLPWEGDHE